LNNHNSRRELLELLEEVASICREMVADVRATQDGSEESRAMLTKWEANLLVAEHRVSQFRSERDKTLKEFEDGIQRMIDEKRWLQ
jgi:hypothetical protein